MNSDYEILDETLKSAGAAMGAAESHGILCGKLAVQHGTSEESWVRDVFDGIDEATASSCRESLTALYHDTCNQLDDQGMTFQPFLPDDNAALEQRVEALGEWCRGFTVGLALSGLTSTRLAQLSDQSREFLSDLNQIVLISSDVEENDESETNYVELLEYIRVGVLFLFEEFRPKSPQPTLH